jgi:hypothetical protein
MVDGGSSSNFSIGYTTSLNNEWNFLTATRSSSGVVSASINGNSLTIRRYINRNIFPYSHR